jgi:hypothetical protein
LREPSHDAAGRPEIAQASDGADQRVAIGCECKGAVDHLLDAGAADGREVLEADLQVRRQPLQIVR